MLKKELQEAYDKLQIDYAKLLEENEKLKAQLSDKTQILTKDEEKTEENKDTDKRKNPNYQYPSSYDTLTEEQKDVFAHLVNGDNAFLTGNAGTGKSYTTNVFNEFCEMNGLRLIKVAPTGTAAQNIDGSTMHRTFNLDIGVNVKDIPDKVSKVLFSADIILIDEVSMARIDNFEYALKQIEIVNNTRRARNETKGAKEGDENYERPIQVVTVGDFFQLKPVVTERDMDMLRWKYGKEMKDFFPFESTYWDKFGLKTFNLTEVIRQKDDKGFLTALDKIKYGKAEGLNYIRQHSANSSYDEAITLCAKNDTANQINQMKLAEIKSPEYVSYAEKVGTVGKSDLQKEDEEFHYKVGARVLLTANADPLSGYHYTNGSLGTITNLVYGDDWDIRAITVQFDDGEIAEIEKRKVEISAYELKKVKRSVTKKDENGNEITTIVEREEPTKTVIGSYSQFPMRLGYAITIHKSQGKTYDKVNLIPNCIFNEGQLYVALSRVTTCEGLYIDGFVTDSMVRTNQNVLKFYNGEYKDGKPLTNTVNEKSTDTVNDKNGKEIKFFKSNIEDDFDMSR